MLRFVQQILNVPQLHRNIDPVGAVFVNIYKVDAIAVADTWGKIMFYHFQDGYLHNWHFDESHWSTTLLLQGVS